jgi:hypothetical protein
LPPNKITNAAITSFLSSTSFHFPDAKLFFKTPNH